MHPMLKPALRRAWRGRNTVQFGVTPAHAVTLGPMDIATGSFLELLDGTRGLPLLREEARALDLSDRHVDILVSRLAEAGLLDDPDAGGPEADALRRRAETLERQRPDAASLSVVHPAPGSGLRRLAARRAMRVQVRGAGRVGAAIAAVLSGSGWVTSRCSTGAAPNPGTWLRADSPPRRSESAGTRLPGSWCAGRRRAALRGRTGRRGSAVGRARALLDRGSAQGRPLGLRARSGHDRALDRFGYASSLRGSDRSHGSGRTAGAARRHRVRRLPGTAPRGRRSPVASDARAVEVGAALVRTGLRPGSGDGGGRPRRGPCAVLPRRRAPRQYGDTLGGRHAVAGLAVGAAGATSRLRLRCRRAH